MNAHLPKLWSRCDEGATYVGLKPHIRPTSSVHFPVSQDSLKQRKRTPTAILDIPLGGLLTPN